MHSHSSRSGFTLIELLVVIAIIAILAVVVVLTLNPAELLRQSRDANRVSDIATLTSALNLYTTDQSVAPSFSLGIASNTAISVYDPNASTTCGSLGLPAWSAGTGQVWQCSSSSTYRNIAATGWIPVNFSQISSGSPFSSLPVDPVNQTSSGFFYSYNTNGSQFVIAAVLESQKYKTQYGATIQTSYFPEVISGGMPSVSALYNPSGLVAYWPLNEGSGATAYDLTANSNNGTWSGTMMAGSYYTGGKVGNWAGNFDGSTDSVTIPDSASTDFTSASSYTLAAWIKPNSVTVQGGVVGKGNSSSGYGISLYPTGQIQFGGHNGGYFLSSSTLSANNWYFVVGTYSPSATPEGSLYINGRIDSTSASYPSAVNSVGSSTYIGVTGSSYFPGIIDDVRIYNRALSAAEVQALYNAEK